MEQTAHFTLNVPKHAKALAKFVSSDREALQYVCIEPQRGFMTATDTHMLQVVNTECSGEWPENFCALIDPKHIAKIAGKAVAVTVYTEQREKEVTRTINRGAFCGTRKVIEKVTSTYQIAQIECDGITYTTDTKQMRFPDVWRVIPQREGRKAMRLAPESMEALKTFCKLNRNKKYIALDMVAGSNTAIVCAKDEAGIEARTAVMLELAEDAELTAIIGLNPAYLLTCMEGSNGVITFADEARPVMIEGSADATILMPVMADNTIADYANKLRKERALSGYTFAESAAEVVKQLKMAASELWQSIVELNYKNLIPGNYTAKDIAEKDKAKCGRYYPHTNYYDEVTIQYGNIVIVTFNCYLFATLAAWESVTRSSKSVFSVGNVEEVTATVMEPNGDEVAEKKMKLRVLGGGWYSPAKRGVRDWEAPVYCEVNGAIIYVSNKSVGTIDDAKAFAAFAEGKAEQIPSMIKAAAKDNKYFAALAERLGIDAATPEEAANNIRKKAEEREAEQQREIEERRERELQRIEAEKQRRAELLADGKEKLLSHRTVTVEQIELLAEAVGYTIHGRTLGSMREKVSKAVLRDDETVTVWSHNMKQRGIESIAEVVREIAARIKAQAEAEAQQPATATETPEISTDSTEVVNVSTEGEKREEKAKYERINIRDYMRRLGQKLIAYRDMPEVDDFSRRGNMAVIYQSPGGIYYCAYLWYNVAGEILRSDRKQYKRQKSAMDYMLFTNEDLAINPICELEIKADTPIDDYDYYRWMKEADEGNYRTIADKALIEAWYNIFLAAYRRGSGHVLVMNNRGELVDTVFLSAPPHPPKFAPQSMRTASVVQPSTTKSKRRQRARKRLLSAVRNFRTTGQPAKP